jgi:hypothetical protein
MLDRHLAEEQHLEVDVERAAEALDQRVCAGPARPACEPRFLDPVCGDPR